MDVSKVAKRLADDLIYAQDGGRWTHIHFHLPGFGRFNVQSFNNENPGGSADEIQQVTERARNLLAARIEAAIQEEVREACTRQREEYARAFDSGASDLTAGTPVELQASVLLLKVAAAIRRMPLDPDVKGRSR